MNNSYKFINSKFVLKKNLNNMDATITLIIHVKLLLANDVVRNSIMILKNVKKLAQCEFLHTILFKSKILHNIK
jgi:hypothetical protein